MATALVKIFIINAILQPDRGSSNNTLKIKSDPV